MLLPCDVFQPQLGASFVDWIFQHFLEGQLSLSGFGTGMNSESGSGSDHKEYRVPICKMLYRPLVAAGDQAIAAIRFGTLRCSDLHSEVVGLVHRAQSADHLPASTTKEGDASVC